MSKVKTAVIPAAGIGTRMFPLSLSIPKELLPILEVPAIHLAALEASSAGVERLVLVISKGKESLLEYFKPRPELEEQLAKAGKNDLLETITRPTKLFKEVVAVYQDEPKGLGHAVLCAKETTEGERFAVMLPDDVFICEPPCLTQLIEASVPSGGVIALQEVEEKDVTRYGICGGKRVSENIWELDRLVEKPKLKEAPGRLAVMGRYILPTETFDFLAETKPGALGEIQLTDALNRIAKESLMRGVVYSGERFDAGTVEGYIKTQLTLAARDPKYRDFMKAALEAG